MKDEEIQELYSSTSKTVRHLAMGHVDVFTEMLGYVVKPFHREWLDFQLSHPRSLILGPRGFGKSSICTIAYALWKVVRDPDIRILVVSNTFEQSIAFLREIKGHIETDPVFRSLFGDLMGEKWTDSEIVLSTRKRIAKEGTVTALGVFGPLTGRHYDLIIVDDIVDFENSRTEGQRKKLWQWFFTTLMPMLEPEGQIHILGTRYHFLDLYGWLMENGYRDSHLVSRALSKDGLSLWEEKFPRRLLLKKKEEAGTPIFNCQYQNDVEAMREGSIFKYEWLRFYDVVPEDLKIYVGVDLAISQRDTADYFAIAVAGRAGNGNCYVLETFRDRLSFHGQIEQIRRVNLMWKPIRIFIESNSYQASLSQEIKRTTDIPVMPVLQVRDKVTRAQKLSALFENGKVFLRKGQDALVDELLAFPQGEHDDLFDALEIAVASQSQATYVPPSVAVRVIR